ncbi:MAG: hypothetical protein VB078_06970 [Clostridiaceae bacterium]|nr:hypothetical protein [Clostridiaceae bacterium]
MSSAVKRNKYWLCPFFKWDGKAEISCEGGRVKLPDGVTANEYMNTFCAGDWRRCTIAAALLQYYDTEDKKREKR